MPVHTLQNVDKKHRTSVYTFIVKEMLEDWDDAKSMGKNYFSLFCSPEQDVAPW